MKTNLDPIKELRQWVCWQMVDKGGKLTKIPMSPFGGPADSTRPETWGSVREAWEARKANGYTGVGFVFTASDEFVGIDLDHCFVDGEITDAARQIVSALNSYTEMSPSREGLHIICKGTIPSNINKSQEYGVEMYREKRYFTVTGDVYLDAPIAERADALLSLYNRVSRPAASKTAPAQVRIPAPAVSAEQVEAALSYLPVWMEYQDWCNVLMAVHSSFPDERGIAMVEAWSPGYEGEVARKWRSFKQRRDGVTIGTLFHMARGYGWKHERNADLLPVSVVEPPFVPKSLEDIVNERSQALLEMLEDAQRSFPKRAWVINAYTAMDLRLGVVDMDGKKALSIPSLSNNSIVNLREEGEDGAGTVLNDYPVVDTRGSGNELVRFGGNLVVTQQWDEALMLFLLTGEKFPHRVVGLCTDGISPEHMAPILRNASKVTALANGRGEFAGRLASIGRRTVHDCTLPVSPRIYLQSVLNGSTTDFQMNRLFDMATPVRPGQ